MGTRALGSTARGQRARDERWSDNGPYHSAYHRSKAEAHRVARRWRAQGLPVVTALAEGLCLAAEKAPAGEDFVFCGPRNTLRELFDLWERKTGPRVPRWYLARWFMRPQMALMEPLQRMAGLPAFLSRDAVDATRSHLDYSSAKAQRELGWMHPDIDAMWDPIIYRERQLMDGRQGFMNKLRHQPVVNLPN